MNWWRNLKGRIRLAEPLKDHTYFKIGGPAKFFIEPQDPNDLKLLLSLVKRYNFPIFVIGRGSNLLISDKGINGVVLRLNAPYFKKLSYRDNYLNVGSGVLLSRVVLLAQDYGLSGAEFLAGIPGTVGGALAMNAGIAQDNRSIAELVESVTVMDYRGNRKILNKKDIRFGYRTSSLSKYIILSALIKLNRKNKEQINDKIKAYLKYRKLTQDLSKPSAGCIFRNPTGNSAGRLIDLCGLKGKRIGGAGVSLKHANFILNLENAAARDVLQLTDLIKKEVRKKFNIDLKPEIKIWQ
jgi:UDP-N-acetylmuramate dehydrogenase